MMPPHTKDEVLYCSISDREFFMGRKKENVLATLKIRLLHKGDFEEH